MEDSELRRIISFTRYSNYAALFPVFLYFPIGLMLGIVRLFIFLQICLLSYILPSGFLLKRMILRVMLSVTGLPTSIHGAVSTDVKKKILVANHVTSLDPFILAFLHPNILVLESPFLSKNQLELYKTFKLPSDINREEIVNLVKEKIKESEEPLLFFPEKLKTNGKSLLKFSLLPFEVDCPIQPITIQVNRFLFDFSVSTYSSSTYEDLMWCLIFPVTLFKIKYLPVTERKKDETREEFANRFQSNMAKSLGLTAPAYSYHDVTECVKKKSTHLPGVSFKHRSQSENNPTQECSSQAQTTVSSLDIEMKKMMRQVQDVLPDTPTECIVSELRRTGDVDITITNILEGKVEYSNPNENVKVSISVSEGLSFKASKFESSASGRHLSFSERKQAMLEAARLKYRLKHGL